MEQSFEKNNIGEEKSGQDKREYIKNLLADIAEKTDNPEKLLHTISTFAKYLEAKYPDAIQRKLWHDLVGSTPHSDTAIEEDFEGDDSIVRFVEKLSHDI